MNALRICCLARTHHGLYPSFFRRISFSPSVCGKLKKEFYNKPDQKPMLKYGPLADTPDWSYADGRPAPPGKNATRRKEMQRQICQRIIELNDDVNKAMRNYEKRTQLTRKHRTARIEKRFKERNIY